MADEKEKTEEDFWAEFSDEEAKVAEKAESDKDAISGDEAAAPAEPAAPPPEQAPDVWASAPPELRAAHDAQVKALESATTEHARRSIEGRIASYTRRLQERTAAAAQQPAAPTEQAADPLEELAAEYPEFATPLVKKLAPITEKISQFEATEKSRLEAADLEMDANLQANERLLESRHPGWGDYLRQYGAAFGAWINDQPLYLREAFVTNRDAIIDPYSAIETIDAFKSFVAQNQPPNEQAKPAPAAQQQGLNSRRAAQLAGSASPQTVGSRPTVSGIPESGDEQAIWNAFRDIDPDEQKYRRA